MKANGIGNGSAGLSEADSAPVARDRLALRSDGSGKGPSVDKIRSPMAPAKTSCDWLRWQLADSAFPTGGFAHSSGLEAAWQHDEVRNRADFHGWLLASLQQVARGQIPWLNMAYQQPTRLEELDNRCDAFTSNHVANRASRLQGRALLTAAERIFGTAFTPPTLGHFAPIFGVVGRTLEIPHLDTVRLCVYWHLKGVIAAAVRLNIMGPMEAQGLQHKMGSVAEAVVQRGATYDLDDLAQTNPVQELWQGAHDRLYSRLFQS